jgi:hypothetical protein
MIDDAVLPILQRIQEDLAELRRETRREFAALDRRLSREFEIVKQDVRMIRATFHDIGETRVTKGEITVLHEDVNRVQSRLTDLETRVEELAGRRTE